MRISSLRPQDLVHILISMARGPSTAMHERDAKRYDAAIPSKKYCTRDIVYFKSGIHERNYLLFLDALGECTRLCDP